MRYRHIGSSEAPIARGGAEHRKLRERLDAFQILRGYHDSGRLSRRVEADGPMFTEDDVYARHIAQETWQEASRLSRKAISSRYQWTGDGLAFKCQPGDGGQHGLAG